MDRKNLILKNLAETINDNFLDKKLEDGQEILSYIGFAPTGKVHLGYLVPCMKIKDLTLAKCQVIIMIADLHAMLDERRTPENLVDQRSVYYQKILEFILGYIGADMNYVSFIKGSKFQYSCRYNEDLWKLARKVTINASKKAGSEVVKQDKDPNLGSLMYPLMQVIDERHIAYRKVDIELGGLDQRKIFCFSLDQNEDEDKITYLMNPIISLARTGKMSSSDPNGKINFTDTLEQIGEKIKKAYCPDNNADSGIMKLFKTVIFPFEIDVNINLDDGSIITYNNYANFEEDFIIGKFCSFHIKAVVSKLIYELITPINKFLLTQEIVDLVDQCYP